MGHDRQGSAGSLNASLPGKICHYLGNLTGLVRDVLMEGF
jgi:hypothetical protein